MPSQLDEVTDKEEGTRVVGGAVVALGVVDDAAAFGEDGCFVGLICVNLDGDAVNVVGNGSNTFLFNGNLTFGPSVFTPTSIEIFNLFDWVGLVSAPSFGSQYSFTGLLAGNGDEAVGFDLPDISGSSFLWDISNLTTNGTIAIVAVPEPSRLGLIGIGIIQRLVRRRRASALSPLHRCQAA